MHSFEVHGASGSVFHWRPATLSSQPAAAAAQGGGQAEEACSSVLNLPVCVCVQGWWWALLPSVLSNQQTGSH